MSFIKRHWILLTLIALVVAGIAAFSFRKAEPPKYFTTKADRGDIRQVVEATGTINAVTTVQVGSQVSGTIQHLFADFNSQVKKGQIVAQIDPSLFEANVLQSKADLENARANLTAANKAPTEPTPRTIP